jgi:hypothetical protein
MNAKHLIAFAAFACAGSAALADTITLDTTPFVPMRTRAEVKAELLQARAAGMPQWVTEADDQLPALKPVVASTLTREQVRAEVRQMPRPKLDVYNVLT